MPISSDTLTKQLPRMGRRSNRPEMSQTRAKRLAASMVSANKVSPEMEKLIRLLATAGALTTTQIKMMSGLGLRTLQRYFFDSKNGAGHVVDYYRADQKLVTDFRFSVAKGLRHPRVWTLGILGRSLATALGEKPYTYNGFHIRQLTHDVLCAQCVWSLLKQAEKFGYAWQWFNKNDARIISQKDKILAEPDAGINLIRDGKVEAAFYVEFHNENGKARGKKKAEAYYRVSLDNVYYQQKSLPDVLIFCHAVSVIDGYTEAYSDQRNDSVTRYYARRIPKYFQNDPHIFLDVRSRYEARLDANGEYDSSSTVKDKYVRLFTE